ncbi:ketoacyl-ACP synthase III family protein [Streptomyces sp. NBC_01275]|uniref:ketoacyl-ACP synthase III family protein n=1 Tax=Streptomyces sp. NBC_01275 TaxID=2903807 RepID=UPI002251011C|nr:ketoacyl-ACP synthase III family protein [Streptomyces sp. NBC_01275]MCX4762824.1 ketoacyl-ACP synthase III family protein [Streptomyces sp. NBC_01275]
MQWGDVYVRSCAVALGDREPVEAPVAAGRYDPAIREAHGYESIAVAGSGCAADMAVDAARVAIARSAVAPADIGVFVHAYVDEQGPAGVTEPASYVQGMAHDGRARALGLRQGCNGAIASLELGAMYVSAGSAAVLTSADKYAREGDRYHDDQGGVPADGATAMVLDRGEGVARLLATEIVGDGRFSGLTALDPAQFDDRKEYRQAQRKRVMSMMRTMTEAKRDCVRAVLADAGVGAGDIRHWLLPYTGRFLVDRDFCAEFEIDDACTTWDLGRTVGHLTSGGDSFVGLTHLLETGAAEVGDRVVMLGDSTGFAFGCAVLEILAKPAWQVDR